MKNIGKLAVLGAVLTASASFAFADNITLGSYSSTGSAIAGDSNTALSLTGVDLTGSTAPTTLGTLVAPSTSGSPYSPSSSTYTLSPGGVWAGPLSNSSWVGAASVAGPNGTNPPYGYYEFQTTFSATGGVYDLNLNVLADDTVEVLLNNTVIIPFGDLGLDTTCSDAPTGCLASTETNFAALETLGTSNTLDFIVEQAGTEAPGTDPSGIDFNATASQTPEPSSLMLLGTGLFGAAGMFFRRRVAA